MATTTLKPSDYHGRTDYRMSIVKALGIILVVEAHVDGRPLLGSIIYEFHMPLFFICAGYFFSLKYLNREGQFIGKRVKGLYVPFVKWSVFFLLIHNLMFRIGILNEQYGNYSGGVTHPYTWHIAQQRLWNIFFSMGGYDEFLAGAFWFFRGLFVASILYLALYKVGVMVAGRFSRHDIRAMQRHGRLLERTRLAYIIGVCLCVLLLGLSIWKCAAGLTISTLVQGGYRDLMGCFFFGIGFLLKPILTRMPRNLAIDALLLGIVIAFSQLSPSNMSFNATLTKCLALPIPAVCGFLFTYDVSCRLERLSVAIPVRRFLIYCGNNTLIVFVLHICAYKLVTPFKIMYYGLPWGEIGCHMTVHEHADDLFWIPYTVVGVAAPLLFKYACGRIATKVSRR